MQNFAVELQIETADELNYEFFREAVHKAGGANYGTGVRELWLFLFVSFESFCFSFFPPTYSSLAVLLYYASLYF